ncbi:MAG: DUF3169 family protein [Lachnospiraceae bacterium]|nr:DUF3169 family protein [Lachnospiraceae bacterium]
MSDEKRLEEIRKEDKKKAPLFFIVIAASGVLGGVGGFFLASHDGIWDILFRFFRDNSQIVTSVYCILMLISGISFITFCEVKLASLKKLWKDEADRDDNWDRIEKGLGVVVNALNVGQVFNFMLNGCAFYNIRGNIKSLSSRPEIYSNIYDISFFTALIGFTIFLFLFFNLQRRAVQFEKILNPEKKGSVFDFAFRKKWVKSFDEAELKQIGIASFKAVSIVNYTCISMILVLTCLGMIAEITVVPLICVSIIWIVQLIAFGITSEKEKWKK